MRAQFGGPTEASPPNNRTHEVTTSGSVCAFKSNTEGNGDDTEMNEFELLDLAYSLIRGGRKCQCPGTRTSHYDDCPHHRFDIGYWALKSRRETAL